MFAGAIAAVKEAGCFDGTWSDVTERDQVAAVIKDGGISWADGASSVVVALSPTKLITHIDGKTQRAERLADGSLQWDTGSVWAPFEENWSPSPEASGLDVSAFPNPVPPEQPARTPARPTGRQAARLPALGSTRIGSQGAAAGAARKRGLAIPRRAASSAAPVSARSPRAPAGPASPRRSSAAQRQTPRQAPPALLKAALDQSSPVRYPKPVRAPERPPPLLSSLGQGAGGGAKTAPQQPAAQQPRRGLLFKLSRAAGAGAAASSKANERYLTDTSSH